LPETKTLAYYEKLQIKAVKSFKVQAPGEKISKNHLNNEDLVISDFCGLYNKHFAVIIGQSS